MFICTGFSPHEMPDIQPEGCNPFENYCSGKTEARTNTVSMWMFIIDRRHKSRCSQGTNPPEEMFGHARSMTLVASLQRGTIEPREDKDSTRGTDGYIDGRGRGA